MERQASNQNVAIAAAPAGSSMSAFGANGNEATMPFTCQMCTKRKIKCDKAIPVCGSCRKGKLQCLYQAPPPRQRKRKLSDDLSAKLSKYERILSENGLLPDTGKASSTPATEGNDETDSGQATLLIPEPASRKPGRLMASGGKSRYVDSNIWRNIAEDDIQRISDEEEEEGDTGGYPNSALMPDPLTGAFMGYQQAVTHLHPTHQEAMLLWSIHLDRVEPICKTNHIPTTRNIIYNMSQQPELASKADECLMFAIYYFAVFASTAEECQHQFAQSRDVLLERYSFATRQALVNANFLKTTEMAVLKALVLHLHASRNLYDPHTNWILTGVASRISQRMGLHKDAETHGLPPFEVQMRRRMFYQVIPLDGMASQMAGIGMAFVPEEWDTNAPLNINDDQIWPGMTEPPEEQRGATEMIFCLARACVGKFMGGTGRLKDYTEAEPIINQAERDVEENYIRFCDVTNPLHFLTMLFARSAINAMRMRTRLPKVKGHHVSDEETHEILRIAQKILDTDTSAYNNLSLRKYMWHVNAFFAWGSWDAIIFILTTLRRPGVLTQAEVDGAWLRMQAIYTNHDVLLDVKRAVQIAMGRLTLRAWTSNPPTNRSPEPAFITTLRSLRKVNPELRTEAASSNTSSLERTASIALDPSPSSDANALFGSLSGGMNLELGSDFNLDTADWMFWDQLIQDYQSQGTQQDGALLLQSTA